MKVRRTYALVVGGGPTGITTSLYFQKYGIPHILVEKDKCIDKIPKAHYYNNQTMEVWRGISHLDKCIANETEDLKLWKTFQYGLSIKKDKKICSYDNFFNKYIYNRGSKNGYVDTYYEDISPSKVAHLSQYKLLGILYTYYLNYIKCDSNKKRDFLKKIKLKLSTHRLFKNMFSIPDLCNLSQDHKDNSSVTENEKCYKNFLGYDPSELLIGYKFVNFMNISELNKIKEGGDKIETEQSYDDNCENDKTNKQNFIMTCVKNLYNNEEEIIFSNYVFVSEGGKSEIKTKLNINDENKKDYMKFVNIHFSSIYLSKLVRYNPSMLYFIFNKYIGVLVCHNYKHGDFVLHIPYIIQKELEIYNNKTKCLDIINTLVGFQLNDIHIYNIYKWTMHSSIASTFVDKKSKRIILLGDSAHKLPPSGGFGLNLGVGDALNMTWKIIRIFKFEKDSFFENIKNLNISQVEKSDYKSYLKNEINKNNDFYNLLDKYKKDKIDNYIDSYNIERKLVAYYTIFHAVKNYEKGNNISSILGYNHSLVANIIEKISNHFIQNSFLFYSLINNVKVILHFINTLPYVFEYKQIKSENCSKQRGNILNLLYPGIDACYSYINTMNPLDEKKVGNWNNEELIKKRETYENFDNSDVLERVEKNEAPNMHREEIDQCSSKSDNKMNDRNNTIEENHEISNEKDTIFNALKKTNDKIGIEYSKFIDGENCDGPFLNSQIFEKKKDNIPRLKVCENIYEYKISSVNGAKIPHFNLYTFGCNNIYKISTIDLPVFNNPFLSFLVIVFDNTFLNNLIDDLFFHKIDKDKFSFCFWDSDVVVYQNEKNQQIEFVEESNFKNLDNNIYDSKININNNLFSRNNNEDILGNISKVKYKEISPKGYNVNYIFSAKIIQEMFLNVLQLKSKNSYVIVRPDKHIISASSDNLLDKLIQINKLYI
ncbi:FAD-dependent monooxygenase, putative [Plasmodium vinckei brucechwatti]|uniref:FAD-dependent monooxygenase, putative n=1 Tax=Plasmodium vinckei brucechwatti TaxID=119398 RepID=A0A6V7SZ63_PLAVN|nr:FAD-dependent monooxygenase, putative [Plasmodium vinckei brucechwatti]